MTRLNLITFASSFQKQEEAAVRETHAELFAALDSSFAVHVYLYGMLDQVPAAEWQTGVTVLFIATGGTEGLVVERYGQLPKPTVLLTDGKANSLAASLELACWIRQQGDDCRIIHGSMEHVVDCLKKLPASASVAPLHGGGLMRGQRIGVVGEPSDWLVASGVDYRAARRRWGVEYVDVPLARVVQYFAEDDADVWAEADDFLARAQGCVEPTRDDVGKAVRLYHALKRIAAELRLDALTVQCFSLIPATGTTGCLALALLNDEGIVAGCEGDLQSIFTMLLARRATGVDGFMANPACIDTAEGTITLAHCTIGLRQTQGYTVRSHFESQSGVAIQGMVPTGAVTIVKCGGADLSRYKILTGELMDNLSDERMCRTQLLVRLDADNPASYFLDENIGNHHIVLQGNHRAALEAVLA